MKKICLYCGKSFEANASHQKYCCRYCKDRYRYVHVLQGGSKSREETQRENAETKITVIKLHIRGWTAKQIIEKFNIRPDLVYSALKEAGVSARSRYEYQRDQIAQLIDQGLNYTEIAEKLGKDRGSIRDIAERIGKKPSAEAMQRAQDIGHQKLRKDDAEVCALISERIPSFEFYGNYTGSGGRADIKCLTCGSVITRNVRSIRKGHVVCDVCIKNEQTIREKLREEKREKARKQAEEQKRQRFWNREFNQISMKQCPVCRGMFVSNTRRYCSDECAKTVANQKGRDRRLRKIKNAMIDSSITLDGLINRDGNVCYICGRECDRSDYWVNDNGVVITGDSYPSIDHVIPLAKGGLHEWSNVKLAHRRCNYLKRDEVIAPPCVSV